MALLLAFVLATTSSHYQRSTVVVVNLFILCLITQYLTVSTGENARFTTSQAIGVTAANAGFSHCVVSSYHCYTTG